ncbi:hypothetical protein AB0C84_44630 [Actinomadura sp. NPDC048955]|uniref:hypothetical protein n=1 Tax=Actinomadura sp. NPDC048955 TaxID=3158228 RepID=UPI003401E3D2
MDIVIDRRSVHAGDDTMSHSVDMVVADNATLGDFLAGFDFPGYLPHIMGRGCGTWDLCSAQGGSWRAGAHVVARVDATNTDDVRVKYVTAPETPLANLAAEGGKPYLLFR